MAIGPILREARQQKQLTASQVAEMTRMKVQIVEDLENDDFHRVAATIYGKGFIKLFAEIVDLDPDPLIADYLEQVGAPRPQKLPAPPPADTTDTTAHATPDPTENPDADDLFSFASTSHKRTTRINASSPAPAAKVPQNNVSATNVFLHLKTTILNSFENTRTAVLRIIDAGLQKMSLPGKSDKLIQFGLVALAAVVLILILIPIARALLAARAPRTIPDNEYILFVPPPEPYLE